MLRLGATAALLILAVCLGFPRDAAATTAWKEMHANTYGATPASARAQCEGVPAGSVPGLTLAKCELLEQKLMAGEYSIGASPHQLNYHYIAGVGSDRVQQLGFEPRALSVDLGDGVVVHWFTGEKRSCNNIAFVKPIEPSQARVVTYPTTFTYLAPLDVCGCVYVPGVSGVIPGGTWTTFGNNFGVGN